MTDERFLVRRGDGQVILLTLVLYTIASKLDGHRDLERVAAEVSEQVGESVPAPVIAEVIDTRLRPLGIIASESSAPSAPVAPQAERAAPVLSLTLRGTLLPSGATRRLARLLCPLHWPPLTLLALEAFIVAEVWLFAVHGVTNSFSDLTARPLLLLPVIGLVLACSVFHELGHASACRYGGGQPGRVGYGIMLLFPAFYTDVTDAYRLPRKARVRTDLGGVYFNAIGVVALTGLFYATGYLPLVAAVILINVNMVQQMLPLVRLDGYYLLSDLVGVPDLFARIGPILRLHDPRRQQLRPAARRVVTAWVLIVVPVLFFGLAEFLWHLPHFLRSTYDGLHLQWTNAYWSWRLHRWQALTLAFLSMLFLAIPVLGIAALTGRLARRLLFRPTRTERSTDVQDEGTQAEPGRAADPGPGYRGGAGGLGLQRQQPGPGGHRRALQAQHQDQLPGQ